MQNLVNYVDDFANDVLLFVNSHCVPDLSARIPVSSLHAIWVATYPYYQGTKAAFTRAMKSGALRVRRVGSKTYLEGWRLT